MTILEKLEPCPFCGSDDLVPCCNGEGNNWISCNSCQAEGPTSQTPFNWNRRPEASALIRELVEALERIEGHYTDTGLAAKHMAAIARNALSKVKPLSSPLGSDTDG